MTEEPRTTRTGRYTVPLAIEEVHRYFTQLLELHEALNDTIWDVLPAEFERVMNLLRLMSTRIDFLFDNAAAAFFDEQMREDADARIDADVSVTRPAEQWITISQIPAWPPRTIQECEAVTDLVRTARRAVQQFDAGAQGGELSPPG